VNLRREFEIPMFATAEQARSDYWAQTTNKTFVKIIALNHDGKKIPIAMNLKGRDTVQLALEAIGGLSGYKIE